MCPKTKPSQRSFPLNVIYVIILMLDIIYILVTKNMLYHIRLVILMIHTFIRILSQWISTSSGAACRPRAPGSTSPAHSGRSNLPCASEGWESWTVGHGPTYIFVGRKNCDLWRCLRLEPVTAIKIPSLIPYLQIFFAFNLYVMSQLGFPLSGCDKC